MQHLPHLYSVTAAAAASGAVSLQAEQLPPLRIAGPAQFGGPGDQWSPETLLAGAVASCFLLSFRAVARALHLEWLRLDVEVDATLDRKEQVMQFTRMVVSARLVVPAAANSALCQRALDKAEHGCLVANSLRCERELRTEIVEASAAHPQSAVA